jgi:acyl-CoA synthetase (NDP forming)
MFGVPAFPSLDGLPEVPELALVAGGRALSSGGRDHPVRPARVKGAVVISAGFSEVARRAWSSRRGWFERRWTLGSPWSGQLHGVISNERSLHATGFVSLHPHRGGLSFISQSGNVGYKP